MSESKQSIHIGHMEAGAVAFGDHASATGKLYQRGDVRDLLRVIAANRAQLPDADALERDAREVEQALAQPSPDKDRVRALLGDIAGAGAGVAAIGQCVADILTSLH